MILFDVADVSGEDLSFVSVLAWMSLGAVSGVRLISRSEIESLFCATFPDAELEVAGADFTRVTLSMKTPDPAEISALLKAHLESVTPWRQEELEIFSLGNLENVDLPPGGVELRVAGRGAPMNYSNFLVPVEAVLDGRFLCIFWVKADVRVRV